MNREEAKSILPLHRPGTADAADPQVATALELAKHDPELARWLESLNAGQAALRGKFRQIEPPAGLKEQIISEESANLRAVSARRNLVLVSVFTVVALLAVLAVIPHGRRDADGGTLAAYQRRMAGYALRGYVMDLQTNNPARIQAFLGEHHAPANFVLPPSLNRLAESGCAIQSWETGKVSMVCFRTGKPLQPGTLSDLWLFVVDRGLIKDAPMDAAPRIAEVNRLITATWTRDGKVYFLGTEGGEQDIRKFLL